MNASEQKLPGLSQSSVPCESGRDLVQAALGGRDTPRVPVGPLAVHFCAGLAGVTVRQYTTNARILAESVIRYYERFRPDAIWLSADTWISAEAMGAVVGAVEDQQVFGGLGGPLVRTTADIDRIPTPDVGTRGRYPLMLEALTRIVQAVGREAYIVACFDQFPFSLAAASMGISEVMLKLLDDPPMVEALMERCLEYGVAYATALGEAGADLLSGGDSPAGLLGPQAFRRLALPFERRLIARLKAKVHQPISLHICGNSTALLADMGQSGADVLEIDHQVDLAQACEIVDPRVALWGNLDTLEVLARGTPESVRAAGQRAIQNVRACGRRRFVLSSGCTLAMETPAANLEALLKCQL
jgi:MtaA/CmuA family methyltransferase